MIFSNPEDFAFFQHFYEKLRQKVYKDLLEEDYKVKYNIQENSPKLWEYVKDADYKKTFKGNGKDYFYRNYRNSSNHISFSCNDLWLSAALDFLDIKIADTYITLKSRLARQIATYKATNLLFYENLESLKHKEIVVKNKENDIEEITFKNMIGYTGNGNVYLVVRKSYDPKRKLDFINSHDDVTANVVKQLLEKENVKYQTIQFFTNEKKDIEGLIDESDHYPNKKIPINPNDIFIVVGLYGYNIIPEITELNSNFFSNLLYKWEDPNGETEFTELVFRGYNLKFGVRYANLEKHIGGESHGIFSKIKYGSYTCIQLGGAGQEGTEALGCFFEKNREEIYKEILKKSDTPHSFAVLFWLNLDNYVDSKILESVVISVH